MTTIIIQGVVSILTLIVGTLIPSWMADKSKVSQKVTESVTTTEGIYAKELPKLLDEIQTLLAKNVEITNELLEQERQYSELASSYAELKEQLDGQVEENKKLIKELKRLKNSMVQK